MSILGSGLTLADVVAAILVIALNAYVLTGGADFGGGIWDCFAFGKSRAPQRALITRAIGPIWEANHVWLIIAVVMLFTCFPAAFAQLAVVLHVPLTLMLIGIVLRGSAFVFRAYDSQHSAVQERWSRVFAGASIITPVILGMCVGALVAGDFPSTPETGFVALYIRPWLTPFGVGVGVLTLVLFAFLAAVYLTVEADDDALREAFRRRALVCAAAAFAAALGVLLLSHRAAPRMRVGLTSSSVALPLHVATAAAAITAIWALWTRRWRVARAFAVMQVTLILWGWALAQYPLLVPPGITIQSAAAPAITLELVLGALAVGSLILFPSLYYLMRVFKGDAPSPMRPPPPA